MRERAGKEVKKKRGERARRGYTCPSLENLHLNDLFILYVKSDPRQGYVTWNYDFTVLFFLWVCLISLFSGSLSQGKRISDGEK